MQYLILRHGGLVDATGNTVPGSSTDHGRQQSVELPCVELFAVLPDRLQVLVDESLPQSAVLHSELFRENLRKNRWRADYET